MFTEALFGNTQELLAVLGKSRLLKNAYLAGGTALALQLGHRISVDLDFFTSEKFDAAKKAKDLKGIGGFSAGQLSRGTVQGHFKKVRFGLFFYEYPVLFSLKEFRRIKILDLRDIAAMKVAAISDRGTKRDFIDLYFLCQKISLDYALKLYDRKFRTLKANLLHIQKSLVYFEDAEKEETPKMLKDAPWRKVKEFFEREVKKLAVL